MKLILLTFFISGATWAMDVGNKPANRCAAWLLPAARIKRSAYVDRLVQYDLSDMNSRVWESFLPRVRRWVTDSEMESQVVRAYANAYFFEYQDFSLLLNDRTPVEVVTTQIANVVKRAPGMVLWIAVTPGSTISAPQFRPLHNYLDSLGAQGKLVLIVYETGPTAFDFSL